MGRAKQIDRHRPHWGIVLVTLALFLWGCTTLGVPTHLENQGWRLATLWAVRPAAEFKVPKKILFMDEPTSSLDLRHQIDLVDDMPAARERYDAAVQRIAIHRLFSFARAVPML